MTARILPQLTAERLRELLDYDPISGALKWKSCAHVPHKVRGKIAGAPKGFGYIQVQVDGKNYAAHILIWLYVHGTFPKVELDHKNNVGNDNRIDNLREVSRSQNNMNRLISSNNTSGFKGVSKSKNRWFAQIQIDGLNRHLGRFRTAEDAAKAYDRAAIALFGEFAKTNSCIRDQFSGR